MTLGFGSILMGIILMYSGLQNLSVPDVILGRTPPPHAGVSNSDQVAAAEAADTQFLNSQAKQNPADVNRQLKNQHPELHLGIRNVVAQLIAHFPTLQITATTNGRHAHNSLHYVGRACDLSADARTMEAAAAWAAKYLTPLLTEGIHNPNLSVKNHRHASPSIWGSTVWSEHANHIHVAV